MSKVTYILLCHKNPEEILLQINALTAQGDYVAVHFDARGSQEDFNQIKNNVEHSDHVVFAKRVKGGWGGWSLVQGTLNALQAAERSFPHSTHFYLLSGDCFSIKSAEHIHEFLDENDKDFIEHHDFFTSDWIKTGMRDDRLLLYHIFNERTQKRLFYAMVKAQRLLGVRRRLPKGVRPMIGSQWWCLRRQTIEAILEFLAKRPDVTRFFKRSWIPDETFFQTLVMHLIPKEEVESRSLTFLMFTDYGFPVTFQNDHFDYLLQQNFLFARKISGQAHDLKARLAAVFNNEITPSNITHDGRNLYSFMASRGREGRRFNSRIWERGSQIGAQNTLYVVVCKKWHVGKRLMDAVGAQLGIPSLGYCFNELDDPLWELGGAGETLAQRLRHPRAFLRMIFEERNINNLMVGIDSANYDLLRKLSESNDALHVLEVECEINDAYLVGHAMRAGLLAENVQSEVVTQILPTLREDFAHESHAISQIGLKDLQKIRERDVVEAYVAALMATFECDEYDAYEIARTPHIFED